VGKVAKLRDIVVLGLLSEQPRYGYEIKMIIDHIMSYFLDVSSGSLYYGIKKLQQMGYIEETTVEKVGRRPERSVYKITDEGHEYLEEQLPEFIFPRNVPFFPINTALFFLDTIPVDERIRRLVMWRERLLLSKEGLHKILDKYATDQNTWHVKILKHRLSYTEHELPFIEELLNELPGSEGYELSSADRRTVKRDYSQSFEKFDYSIYSGHLIEDELAE